MLCDDCGRNEATVHIVQIGPDGRVEKNLCQKCLMTNSNITKASTKTSKVTFARFNAISDAICSNFQQI